MTRFIWLTMIQTTPLFKNFSAKTMVFLIFSLDYLVFSAEFVVPLNTLIFKWKSGVHLEIKEHYTIRQASEQI